MIEIQLTKAEALLYMEMIKRNSSEMLEQIGEQLNNVVTHEEMASAARSNYVTNLENEIKNLRAQIDAKNLASESNVVPRAKRKEAKKAAAPWGYKKDGTPKKRPGRAPGDF